MRSTKNLALESSFRNSEQRQSTGQMPGSGAYAREGGVKGEQEDCVQQTW